MKGKYDDIIDLPYPRNDWEFRRKHPPMSLKDRAKIFSPFAALNGHEDALQEREIIVESKEELLDDTASELDIALQDVSAMMAEEGSPNVCATYFKENKLEANLHLTPAAIRRVIASSENKNLGKYIQISGTVRRIDLHENFIQINDTIIPIKNLRKLEIC